MHLPVLHGPAVGSSATPEEVWNILFNKEMLSVIIKWTNVKLSSVRKKYERESHPEIQNTGPFLDYCTTVLCSNPITSM